jgi:hypothetical protein
VGTKTDKNKTLQALIQEKIAKEKLAAKHRPAHYKRYYSKKDCRPDGFIGWSDRYAAKIIPKTGYIQISRFLKTIWAWQRVLL